MLSDRESVNALAQESFPLKGQGSSLGGLGLGEALKHQDGTDVQSLLWYFGAPSLGFFPFRASFYTKIDFPFVWEKSIHV